MIKKIFLGFFLFLFLFSNVSAEDIAYVVKSSPSPQVELLLIQSNYAYNVISENQIPSTDFSEYSILLIQDNVNNKDKLPLLTKNSIFFDGNIVPIIWNTWEAFGYTSSNPIAKIKAIYSPFTDGFLLNQQFFAYSETKSWKYIHRTSTGPTVSVYGIAYSTGSSTGNYPIIAYSNRSDIKNVFFGFYEAGYWSEDTKKLIKNSLKWMIGNKCTDNDQDYYVKEDINVNLCENICGANHNNACIGNNDCNDNNFNVNPNSIELLYNGIDDDCNGYDLADYDNDGYCKAGYTIINKNLQCPLENGIMGTDCMDNDNTYNPGSSDINKNCQNKAPVIEPLSKIIVNEGEVARITVHASDFENDELAYSINDSAKFLKNFNVFSWDTGYQDSGDYVFKLFVSDGNSTSEIDVEVEVRDINQPPVFNEINCVLAILEDIAYECNISATDNENDSFNFSVLSENKLECSFQNNTLIYKSYQDYFGSASCSIKVSDAYGYTVQLLSVNIQNINDAPAITGYNPQNSPRILNGSNQTFNITIRNVDNDNITTSWFLNNQNVGFENSYIFNANQGSYNLTAVVTDGEYSINHYWDVFVGFADELTCNEAHGFLCSSGEVCNGNLLGVLDSNSCCNAVCSEKPPIFKDISKQCKNKSSELEIKFKDITSMEKFKIGEITSKKVEIKNNASINLNSVLEIYVYDLTKDKILKKEKYSFNMGKQTYKIQNFDIDFPWDINEKYKFAIFINIKGNGDIDYCNSDYIRILPYRVSNEIVLENAWIDKTDISCGDSFDLYARIRNTGTEEQDVILKFDNSLLKIKDTSDEIALEGYGADDSEKITSNLNIPDNAKAGNYTIKISALSNTGAMAFYDLEIALGECKKEASSSSKIGIIKLQNSNILQIFEDSKNRNFVLWNSIIVSLILSFLLITVICKGIKRRKTKKQLEKEINKIIKRKNSRHKKQFSKQKKKSKK